MALRTLQLPEPCRVGLAQLHTAVKQAEREYTIAQNSAVLALGLDPKDDITLSLDTGVIEIAEPTQPDDA